MENALNIIFSTENVRTLAIIVSVISCTVWNRISIKKLEFKTALSIKELEYKIEVLEHKMDFSIKELKVSTESSISELRVRMDSSFKALTYVLEKNGSMSKEDKEFVGKYGQLPVAAPL